jgi:hypothetical protein
MFICRNIRGGHRWQYGACALQAGYVRLQTHTQKCNIYYFSTATVVARTRLDVTFTCIAFLVVCFCYSVWVHADSADWIKNLPIERFRNQQNARHNISLHWPGRALKRKKIMWNNSIEISKNNWKCAGLDSWDSAQCLFFCTCNLDIKGLGFIHTACFMTGWATASISRRTHERLCNCQLLQ